MNLKMKIINMKNKNMETKINAEQQGIQKYLLDKNEVARANRTGGYIDKLLRNGGLVELVVK